MNQSLQEFLESDRQPEGTLTYHEVQGFLFAITCSPEMIKPSEWLPLVFNEKEAYFESEQQAQDNMSALMVLYNEINQSVLDNKVKIPEDIIILDDALSNIGEKPDLGQWSRGFSLGHEWLNELWDEFTPKQLDDELGSCLLVLSFFSSTKLASAFYSNVAQRSGKTKQEFAANLLTMLPGAIKSYALLSRSIQMALAEHHKPSSPLAKQTKKVGRNELCPCGSGKKFKHCCLQ